MPFGPYADFDDCVAQNGDKASPEGFCAFLHHKITGNWPGAMAMPQQVIEVYCKAYDESLLRGEKSVEAEKSALAAISKAGWQKRSDGWLWQFQAPRTRIIYNVEIFASGTWIDSSGQRKTWLQADLDSIVKGFANDKSVPLKAGHTTDEFNTKVAQVLGVPIELVKGEHGKGQIALGYVDSLQRKGDKLLATFKGVPEAIADLVEANLYSNVSAEIDVTNDKPALTGVALLGAEQPAVDVLKGLELAGVHSALGTASLWYQAKKLEEDKTMIIQFELPDGGDIKTVPVKDFTAHFQGNDVLTAIAVALGLDQNATLADVLKKVQELMAGGVPAEAGVTPEGGMMQKQEFTALQETVKAQNLIIAEFQHERRVAHYQKAFEDMKNLAGKPEDMAEKFAGLEEKAGEEIVQEILAQYQEANKATAVMTETLGRARSGLRGAAFNAEPVDEWEKTVVDFAKTNKVTREQATAQLAGRERKEFAAYRERKAKE